MIKHFAADGTVKREWPDGLHASGFEQDGKRFASVAKSNAVETVELADGEQVGEAFIPQTAAQAAREVILQAAAEDGIQVHESQLAPPMPIAEEDVSATDVSAPEPLPPVAIAPEPEPTDTGVVFPTHAAISGSTTVHHVPLPSEVVETAAHALSDAAEVLKQEEARNASSPGAEK